MDLKIFQFIKKYFQLRLKLWIEFLKNHITLCVIYF